MPSRPGSSAGSALRSVLAVAVMGAGVAAVSGGDHTEPKRDCVAACAHPPFSRPLISIEFDDGFESAYRVGLPIVESFGWRAQVNVITGIPLAPQDADRTHYMTDEQVLDWSRHGDIGSHSVTHPNLAAYDADRVTRELADSRAALEALIGRTVSTFATPGCHTSPTVASIAPRYYRAVRNCDSQPYVNTNHNFDRWNLRAYSVKNGIPAGWILDQLAQTKAANGWSIFYWHRIDDTPTGDAYTSTTAQFRRDLQLIRDSGITVVTSHEALAEELGHPL